MPFWKKKKKVLSVLSDGAGDSNLVVSESLTSNEAPGLDDKPIDEGRLGMFILEDKPSDALTIIDIVAIHGLNGHYQNTWSATAPSGEQVNWLKDLLPRQIPNARIMSYGYNSAVQFSKSVAVTETFAEQLLEDLISWRNSYAEQRRPVIFICHSLGGIVFKQALIKAHERARFAVLIRHIQGVAFFGTPHRGADLARWGSLFGNILKAASFGTSTNTKLSRDLESRSEMLRQISKSFVERGKDLIIFSFYETDKLEFLSCRVVDEDSATLGWPNETSIPINGDHRSICQFTGVKDPRYRNVWVNLQKMTNQINNKELTGEENAYLSSLHTSEYESHRRRNSNPVKGTCVWLLNHPKYQEWLQNQESSIVWLSANPGCGKSVLSSFLIDVLKHDDDASSFNLCYFFFKDDNREQRNATFALSALLHQIYTSQPRLVQHFVSKQSSGNTDVTKHFSSLWNIFKATVTDPGSKRTICIIDGLDECDKDSRKEFAVALAEFFKEAKQPQENTSCTASLKVLILSRPDNIIRNSFSSLPNVRLRGEDEIEAVNQDVDRVVQASMNDLEKAGLPQQILVDLQHKLVKGADMTFLWTTLMIKLLEEAAEAGASKTDLQKILQSKDIYAIYHQLLQKTSKQEETIRMLQIVVAAARPLTLLEMSIAMEIRRERVGREEIVQMMKHPFENYVKSLCGHFLRIIHGRIYLVHQTARLFLLQQKTKPSSSRQLVNLGSPVIPQNFIWRYSIILEEAQFLLLNICVAYLYMIGGEIENRDLSAKHLEGQVPDLGLLDYAAKYWPLHRRQVGNIYIEWETWWRYDRLCDPDFAGFGAWVQKHPSYVMNFPGRMYIQGARNNTRDEILEFFGLDEVHLRADSAGMGQPYKEEENMLEGSQSECEDNDQGLDQVPTEEVHPAQLTSATEIRKMSDRFSHYRRMQDRELERETALVGLQIVSGPPKSHSFPEIRSSNGKFSLLLDKQ